MANEDFADLDELFAPPEKKSLPQNWERIENMMHDSDPDRREQSKLGGLDRHGNKPPPWASVLGGLVSEICFRNGNCECNHPTPTVTRLITSNGCTQTYILCSDCKIPLTEQIAGSLVSSFFAAGIKADDGLYDEMKVKREKEQKEWNLYYRNLEIQRRQLASLEHEKQEKLKQEQERQRLHAMPYKEYLLTPHWLELSERIKARDGYRCVLCNSSDKIEGHHRTYERRGYELESDVHTLCHPCHAKHHNKEKEENRSCDPWGTATF